MELSFAKRGVPELQQTESGFTEEPEETLDDAMVRLVRKHGAFAVKDEYLQALLEVD